LDGKYEKAKDKKEKKVKLKQEKNKYGQLSQKCKSYEKYGKINPEKYRSRWRGKGKYCFRNAT
jgi:hypothetical protein